jgi:hypothetical protein
MVLDVGICSATLAVSVGGVQDHLRKVFAKLDINSRNQLARALPSGIPPPFSGPGNHSGASERGLA